MASLDVDSMFIKATIDATSGATMDICIGRLLQNPETLFMEYVPNGTANK